jgi:hypothetical protein
MDALAAANDAAVQMIGTRLSVWISMECVSPGTEFSRWDGPRGGLTSKIHAVVDTNGLGKLLPRLRAGSMLLVDRGYDADWIRELAIRKGTWANIPAKSNRDKPICFQPIPLTSPQYR